MGTSNPTLLLGADLQLSSTEWVGFGKVIGRENALPKGLSVVGKGTNVSG